MLAAETWHRTLSQTDGKDKLFRLLQYLCKLLRGLDAGRSPPRPNTATAKVASLETALATSRQIWRLFKWASVYAKSKQRISSISTQSLPPLPDLAALIADAGLFSYYVFDNVTFLHKTKLVAGDVRSASRRAAKFWLTAVLASLVGSVHTMLQLHRRQQRLLSQMKRAGQEKKDDNATGSSSGTVDSEADVRSEYLSVLRQRKAAMAVCTKHSGDLIVAWSLTRQQQLHPAIVGACGFVSSVVAFWQLWPKYMPTE